jgi:hypothetical protein
MPGISSLSVGMLRRILYFQTDPVFSARSVGLAVLKSKKAVSDENKWYSENFIT